MRVIYLLRAAQTFLILACFYRLLAVEKLCSNEPVKIRSESNRLKRAVHLPTDPEYPNFKGPRKMMARSLEKNEVYLDGEQTKSPSKETKETTPIETTTATIQREETTDVTTDAYSTEGKKEEATAVHSTTEEKKKEATEVTTAAHKIVEEKKITVTHLHHIKENKEESSGNLGEEVIILPAEKTAHQLGKTITVAKQVCINVSPDEILFAKAKYTISLILPSWTAIFLLIMLDVFVVEIIFIHYHRREYNKKGSLLSGTAHILLVVAAGGCMIFFRSNWSDLWLSQSPFIPIYPAGWHFIEFAMWILLISHLLEMIFYRGVRAEVIVKSDNYDSYNVAVREEGRIYPTYVAPHDGSYEL